MDGIERKFIDWVKTGKNLQLLRNDNVNLRRCSCRAHNLDKEKCDGGCQTCRFQMDSDISRRELADLFGVSDNVIYSWETGRTPVGLEDLLFYCQLAQVELDDIVVFMD